MSRTNIATVFSFINTKPFTFAPMYLKEYAVRAGKNVLVRFPQKIGRSLAFLNEFRRFKRLADDRFRIRFADVHPCLTDKIKRTPFDAHYTYHPAWAARKLQVIRPAVHVDISSILSFCTVASAFLPVRFYDYRPATLNLSDLETGFQDLTRLSFEDGSIESLSCMHTVEHIGLGRYGDAIDPQGDLKAMSELKRVIRPNGDLLFVTPVGRPKIEFNAHRIYSYEHILESFRPFTLKEFSMVTDTGKFIENCNPSLVAQQDYGCGCFWLKNHQK